MVLYQAGEWEGPYLWIKMLDALRNIGVIIDKPHHGIPVYVCKAKYEGKAVDVIFPEFSGTGY